MNITEIPFNAWLEAVITIAVVAGTVFIIKWFIEK